MNVIDCDPRSTVPVLVSPVEAFLFAMTVISERIHRFYRRGYTDEATGQVFAPSGGGELDKFRQSMVMPP
jgi:hypothetical protein